MFGNLPLVLISHGTYALPTHKWGWAGSIPKVLCDNVPAQPGDIMAGRTYKAEDGKHYRWKPRCYATKAEALADAVANGVTLDPKAGTDNA